MNMIKLILAVLLTFSAAIAQSTFIRGDLNIRYNTRSIDGKVKEGVDDVYTMNIVVSNSAQFRGTIMYRPYIKNTFSNQEGVETFNLDLDVVNPNNPTQTRNIGKMTGRVPIDYNNIYDYNNGDVQVNIFSMGTAKGFDSKYRGTTAGKAPADTGLMSNIRKKISDRINISKSVGGKAVTIAVTKYDKMEFVNHTIAAGPVQIYSEVTVNGCMLYDYERSAWYLQDMSVTYPVDGRMMIDKISGNIRWNSVENKYEFDIRVNEPPMNEASIFSGPVDESAFFTVDNTITSLTGDMKYQDTTVNNIVTGSSIKIDLTGNKLTKHQTMYLAKLVLISNIVPLNAD